MIALWPCYRFFIVILLGFLMSGIVVSYFRDFKISYEKILGIGEANCLDQFDFYTIYIFL